MPMSMSSGGCKWNCISGGGGFQGVSFPVLQIFIFTNGYCGLIFVKHFKTFIQSCVTRHH